MSSSPAHRIGIDFGTTNTSIAAVGPDGAVQLAQFPFLGQMTDAYRSLLYFEQSAGTPGMPPVTQCWTGPSGIEHYLNADSQGRLIQSLKSFLATRNMEGTQVFERKRTIEELISRILSDVRAEASRQFGIEIKHATVGRPVRFVGSDSAADDTYAEGRLAQSFKLAGFESVDFELEPIAAAYKYESSLDHDELILIGDFGGGTSDFSLINVGPSIRARGRHPADLIGNAGVGLAGDAFDAQIVRRLVSPAVGSKSWYQSMHKRLPMPAWPYTGLERWHHLSFLKNNEVLEQLETIKASAIEPAMIDALMHLIKYDLGYRLHRSVQKLKTQLSVADEAPFEFRDGDLVIQDTVTRATFEDWIDRELGMIEKCVDGLLATSKVAPGRVDAVFLTGGTSLVPAVRRIFESRFGPGKIRSGHEFTSVAMGLALRTPVLV